MSHTRKPKADRKPTIKETMGINLQVPAELYFAIKSKADKDTYLNGSKKTIHDKMIEQLEEVNKK